MSCWCITVGLLAVLLGLAYVYLMWNNRYWTRRGVPSIEAKLFAGSFPASFWQRRNQVYDAEEAYRKYRGKVPFIGIYETRIPTLMLLDASYVKAALTTNFKHFADNNFGIEIKSDVDPLIARNPFLMTGEKWKESRGLLAPAFTSAKLKTMHAIVQQISHKLTSFLRLELSRDPTAALEAKEFTAKYTVDVVANCIYGIDSEAMSSRPSALLETVRNIFQFGTKFLIYFQLAQIVPFITRFWNVSFLNKNAERLFVQVTRDAVKARLASAQQRNDFLDHLLKCHQRQPMSDVELAGHTMTFYLDGFETTSTVLSNVLQQIAVNAAVQKRLRHEIADAVAKAAQENDGTDGDDVCLSFEQLEGLPYLEQVLNESLRLTGGSVLTRRCTEAIELDLRDGRTVQIERGTPVLIPVFSLHHDEQFYPEPELFRPERFDPALGGAKRFRDAGVFLPFGDGPRGCLGFRVARMIVKAAVVEVVHHFEVTLNERTRPDDEFEVGILLMVKSGVWLDLKEIKKEN